MANEALDAAFQNLLAGLFTAVEPMLETSGQSRVFAESKKACSKVSITNQETGKRLPVCAWFEKAVLAAAAKPELKPVAESLSALEPCLTWYDRPDQTGTASDTFAAGHANAFVIGPNGLTERTDVWIGVTLLAPDVRYPDHSHPPEELYLALSDGDFRNADTDWCSPGAGGLFHNPPGIVHAMRSAQAPMLAIWTLVPDAA